MGQVIQSLIAVVNDPQPKHPLLADLAKEYTKDHKKFCKNAKAFTETNGDSTAIPPWKHPDPIWSQKLSRGWAWLVFGWEKYGEKQTVD